MTITKFIFNRKWLPAVCGFLLTWVGCSQPPKNELIVGMELNYPPFEMVDDLGKPAGISVELADALGKSLGTTVTIQNIPFDGLIPALKTSKIDLIISSMTATPERAQSIDFSEPYLRTGLCLLVSKQAGIRSMEDLDAPERTVAVKQGTTGQLYAKAHLKNAHLLTLDKEDACVLEIVQNKAQAFIFDQMSIFKHWQRHREKTEALLKPFQEERWAIGIRKGNEALKTRVNAFLAEFRAQGGFDQLANRHLKEQKEAFQAMGLPFYF